MSVEIPIHIFLKSVYVSRVLQKNVLCVNIIFVLANFKTLTTKRTKLKLTSIVSQVMFFTLSVTKLHILGNGGNIISKTYFNFINDTLWLVLKKMWKSLWYWRLLLRLRFLSTLVKWVRNYLLLFLTPLTNYDCNVQVRFVMMSIHEYPWRLSLSYLNFFSNMIIYPRNKWYMLQETELIKRRIT